MFLLLRASIRKKFPLITVSTEKLKFTLKNFNYVYMLYYFFKTKLCADIVVLTQEITFKNKAISN